MCFRTDGIRIIFFDSMVSLLLNEDPQLDHFRAHTSHTSHTRRSIVRTVKNFGGVLKSMLTLNEAIIDVKEG